ncbi:hypothetical protein [Actinomadura gamaensis]|uniref:Uncharacterized protein n=1 Tax=Actinomadura gamaensis TaxID=1763541 RepID=A0ABV9TUD2_9ACTN
MTSSHAAQPLPDPPPRRGDTERIWRELKEEFPDGPVVPASGGSWLGQVPAGPDSALPYRSELAKSPEELRGWLLDLSPDHPAARKSW